MHSNVAEQWLAAMAQTANAGDIEGHLDLISRRVQVFGVPGFETIGYADWERQCRHEFAAGLLRRVAYADTRVRTMAPGHIMFTTSESVEGTDGTLHHHGLEVVLHKEEDGKWRVIQERIRSDEEIAFDAARG